MAQKVLTVSELTHAIKSLLEPNFRSIAVKGEIGNFKLQSSGHLYFNLKDSGSQISAVLFRGTAAHLTRMPKEGDQVLATGEISIYAPRGNYQIIVRELQFLGVGELLLKLHQLKETLQKRGWFEPGRKKPLPKLPKRIGVVTSPTGAVIQDILNVLTRRFAGFQVVLNPVKVQGEGAWQEIARAIQDMNRFELADVLIVGRGGGSIEDLWAFNEEGVAQAIFESKIPIISAVGHETDHTIADMVADVRAPTPSAAAEIAIAEKANLLNFLDRMAQRSKSFLTQQIQERRHRLLALLKHPLISQPYSLIAQPSQQLDDMCTDLDLAMRQSMLEMRGRLDSFAKQLHLLRPTQQMALLRQKLHSYQIRIDDAMRAILSLRKKAFPAIEKHLASLHPRNLLQKGYAILFAEKEDSIILSAKEIQPHQSFRAVMADGLIHAAALQIEEKKDGTIL